MGYDLLFRAGRGELDMNAVTAYFSSRLNYTVNASGARYLNDKTEVGFWFDFRDRARSAFPVAADLNYFRPSFYALEIEPEISGFVREFDLLVADPQAGGMGNGEYVPEKFLRGWNEGNEFAYSRILGDPDSRKDVIFLDQATLLRTWQWNYRRRDLTAELTQPVFVPDIMYLRVNGIPATGIFWPDGLSMAMIPVDYLLIYRNELKAAGPNPESEVVVAWGDVLPVLEKYHVRHQAETLVANYDMPPPDLCAYIQSLPVTGLFRESYPVSKVLDKHLYDRYAV